jgi:hypothetical protein
MSKLLTPAEKREKKFAEMRERIKHRGGVRFPAAPPSPEVERERKERERKAEQERKERKQKAEQELQACIESFAGRRTRAADEGEPALIHEIRKYAFDPDDRHVERFALDPENYAERLARVEKAWFYDPDDDIAGLHWIKPIAGYSFRPNRRYYRSHRKGRAVRFTIVRDADHQEISHNMTWRDRDNKKDVHLESRRRLLSAQMSPEEALVVANLEQCAALILLDEISES